eukprot:CAMPEP_0201883660 /NCGR_PEP_ID=MMETSP0902-20130614/16162_1 /ASSEMBLY_ACC=CAM_ASM_000551 /TAXON_ID=420261 /ORGANISM="Thalassiosira antarctica, Strain CCMP982" /LENGTH=869 /DNA_ID=CAMNT_0048412507 /DNA_START=145 /DNA_END=2754 /DNA_ORIENTATION=+
MNISTSLWPLFSQPPSKLIRDEDLADSRSPFITLLCDDTLLRILSYADLPSLISFTRGTCNSLRHRFHPAKDVSCYPDIWREVFTNLHFAPIHEATSNSSLLQDGELIQTTDYFNAIHQRLSLWSILSGNSRRRKRTGTKQCFSLPSRLFHFVPLLPPDMMHFPPASASGGDNNDISFSYLDDGSDRDVEENDDFEIDMDPNDDDVDANNNALDQIGLMEFDPPPVEFVCDSFSLTSPGTGGEFVVLNPFSGSVEVYGSILDNAISSDESMLEQAMLDASEGIICKRRICGGSRRGGNERSAYHEEDDLIPDENSEVIAGEAISNRVQLNHRMYDTPPKQVLFSVHDYYDLDISEYFGQHTPFAISGQREREVTVDWVGVDSHIALRNDCKSIAGNIIGAARILNMESDHGEEELACTEVLAWSNFEKGADCASSDAEYSSKYVCRAAGSFYFLDICANYQKVYAVFQSGCSPFENEMEAAVARRGDRNSRQLMDIEDESMVNEDGEPIRMSKAVYCLPLIRYSDSPSSCPQTIGSYFPSPDACFFATHPVSSFSVDPSGKILIVGTTCGTVEIWRTGMDSHNNPTAPLRLQILSARESNKRHRSMTMDGRHTSNCEADTKHNDLDDKPNDIEFDDNATETQDDLALLENGALEEEEFPHKHPTSKISQIYIPRHLPVQQGGFITKQRSPDSGTTLLLWQTSKMSSDKTQDSIYERFQITAIINLPLSAQCHPEVHFDGRRLIIFGKDHIGLIILVYHVLGTRFDQHEFDEIKVPINPKASHKKNRGNKNNGEESGGVVQIASERRIKFVNRIRHAGLGGLEYYDSMLMSANERFLVVNTKTGNLIGSNGARNASEGLLVIDLQEHGCY